MSVSFFEMISGLRLALLLVLWVPLAAEAPPTQSDKVLEPEPSYTRIVEVEPSHAKNTLAMRITLAAKPMRRTSHGYESTYSVKVFPFFFFNETGTIRIDLEPGGLDLLDGGEVISFTGEAVNHRRNRRLVTGRAHPADELSGRIRMVVKVSGIELVFDTGYRFVGEKAEEPAVAE